MAVSRLRSTLLRTTELGRKLRTKSIDIKSLQQLQALGAREWQTAYCIAVLGRYDRLCQVRLGPTGDESTQLKAICHSRGAPVGHSLESARNLYAFCNVFLEGKTILESKAFKEFEGI